MFEKIKAERAYLAACETYSDEFIVDLTDFAMGISAMSAAGVDCDTAEELAEKFVAAQLDKLYERILTPKP